MEAEENEARATTRAVDHDADGGATRSPCGTTTETDPDAQVASDPTRNVVSTDPHDECHSTTFGEENRSAQACSEVNNAIQSDGFDSQTMTLPVENNETKVKSTNVEESFDDAASIGCGHEADVVIGHQTEDDEDHYAILHNSVSRLNAKFEALGAPRLEQSSPEGEAVDHSAATVTLPMKMHQLNALDPNKVPMPVDSSNGHTVVFVDPFVSSSNSEAVVLTTPHVYAEALVVGDAEGNATPRPLLQDFSASPANNDNEMALFDPTNTSLLQRRPKRLSSRQRIGGFMAVLLLVTAIAVGTVCGTSGCGRKETAAASKPFARQVPTAEAPSTGLLNSTAINALVEYISNISLSGRAIALSERWLPSSRPEERALAWLIHDDRFNLSLELPSNCFRLQQRYALATLGAENKKFLIPSSHECDWEGITCESIDWGLDVGTQLTVTAIDWSRAGYRGELSADLGLLSSLVGLRLNYNKLGGTIPSSYGRWSKLKSIALYESALTGQLPSSIGEWTSLEYCDFNWANFDGTLPTAICQWRNLTFIDIQNVKNVGMVGPIPDCIGQWTNLRELRFAHNRFNSTLPRSIEQWTKLEHFDVDGNDMTGALPMVTSTNITYYDVRSNFFTGVIPPPIGNLSVLSEAYFQDNEFIGAVPAAFCSSRNVTQFVVSCEPGIPCECCTSCQ